jgi:very-short-patch-repair endonuclease
VCEFQFHPFRKYQLDFVWEKEKVCLEVDGGGFIHGAHSRGSGQWKDMLKRNEATLMGWKVFVVTPKMLTLEDGRAALLLEQALRPKPTPAQP